MLITCEPLESCFCLYLPASSLPYRKAGERQRRAHSHGHLRATAAPRQHHHHGQLRHADGSAVGAPPGAGPPEDPGGAAGAAGSTPRLPQRPATAHHRGDDHRASHHPGLGLKVRGRGGDCSRSVEQFVLISRLAHDQYVFNKSAVLVHMLSRVVCCFCIFIKPTGIFGNAGMKHCSY